ncbi:hypothetical protein ACPOL_0660 [Acidisarcina polymorpha]|uniref:Uncharacterized protein n=1 Tax=Acidisarcina polymorpha TaxID=2211140 RepID=A0A2Z5FU52_9BACT|nr:hypothetical protein ACPOL_0660 [Acidisarcina polymorpha]
MFHEDFSKGNCNNRLVVDHSNQRALEWDSTVSPQNMAVGLWRAVRMGGDE